MFKIEKEDEKEFRVYLDGPKFHSAIVEVLNAFRNKVKHTDEEGSWESGYHLILGILAEEGIDVWSYD